MLSALAIALSVGVAVALVALIVLCAKKKDSFNVQRLISEVLAGHCLISQSGETAGIGLHTPDLREPCRSTCRVGDSLQAVRQQGLIPS
jgi:hypothetical protein